MRPKLWERVKTVGITMPPEMYSRLQEVSRATGLSASAIVRLAVADYLEQRDDLADEVRNRLREVMRTLEQQEGGET